LIKFKENIKPYKVLLQNFTSLSILQISNYVFPIITLPYVVRVLGPEKYGLVNFAGAFCAYFITLSDYGFNLSATRLVSLNRNEQIELDKIFSSVLVVKILLGLLSFGIVLMLILFVELFKTDALLYLISFASIISSILFPGWFFQGLEKMKIIPVINILPKIFGVILIFLLINEPSDYLNFVIINSSVQVCIGAAGLIVALKSFRVHFYVPNLKEIKFQFRDGLQLFKSTLAINLYTNSNTFLLGLLTNNEIVGYYSAADKIRIFFQSLLTPVSQSVFPFVNYLMKESKEKLINFNKMLLKFQAIIGLAISMSIFIWADWITVFVLGKEYLDSVLILKIIGWLPFVIALSNIYGIQLMLPLGFDKQFFKVVATAAIINLCLIILLVPQYQAVGIAIATLVAEIFVSASFIIFLARKGERLI